MKSLIRCFCLGLILSTHAHAADILTRRAYVKLRHESLDAETPARELLAQEHLRRLQRPALPGFAWAILTSGERRQLAVEEEIQAEVDRTLTALWAQPRVDGPPNLGRVQQRAIVDSLNHLFPNLPHWQWQQLWDRVQAMAARTDALEKSEPRVAHTGESIDQRIDLLAEVLAEVTRRLAVAAAADDRSAVSTHVGDALRMILEAYLIAGANAGVRDELFRTSTNMGMFGAVPPMYLALASTTTTSLNASVAATAAVISGGVAFASLFTGMAEIGREYKAGTTPRLLPPFLRRSNQAKLYERMMRRFWFSTRLELVEWPPTNPTEAELRDQVLRNLARLAGTDDLTPYCARLLTPP